MHIKNIEKEIMYCKRFGYTKPSAIAFVQIYEALLELNERLCKLEKVNES